MQKLESKQKKGIKFYQNKQRKIKHPISSMTSMLIRIRLTKMMINLKILNLLVKILMKG